MKPTLDQAGKLIELVSQSGRDADWVQEHLIGSGALSDLLEVDNLKGQNRDERRRFHGLPSLNPPAPPLLEPVDTISIAATGRFVTSERFVVNTSRKAKVKIAYLGDNFRQWFLGKIEASAPAVSLKYGKLTRWALDDEIRKEIGIAEETTLGAIYALMERQKDGKSGVLLTNGWANIFFVRDINGTLRAVSVRWDARGGGWRVGAGSVGDQGGWHDGHQVFSRAIPRAL